MQSELESTDEGWTDFHPGWELRWVREHGRRLRSLRKERRISQSQLADEAGVNVSQVCRVERGRDAQLSTILKLYWGLGYAVRLETHEPTEEAGPLLTREKSRRLERLYAGLDARWP